MKCAEKIFIRGVFLRQASSGDGVTDYRTLPPRLRSRQYDFSYIFVRGLNAGS